MLGIFQNMKLHSGNKQTELVVGLMSGTSLDGLDITACLFEETESGWKYDIKEAETVEYSPEWSEKLRTAHLLSGNDLTRLDRDYGKLLGQQVKNFMEKYSIGASLIASHGHTVFHCPDKGYTLQIGHGAAIAAETGFPVVADFRSSDVALGGQGAPLVPIGDKLLFGEFGACLNLGGFANISFDDNGQRKAGDICPVNIVLNYLSSKLGCSFDRNGDLGRQGEINHSLLDSLNKLDFYEKPLPRSLGREWFEDFILPLFAKYSDSTYNHLRTFYEHIAIQMARSVPNDSKILVTGGGAFNGFLMERLLSYSESEWIVPSDKIVKYKEALIFAFMGLLRIKGQTNCLKSVTGALRNSCCGAVYLP